MRRATAVHDGSVYVGPFATRADLRTFELLAERARRSRP
jgi:hypothetical protein